MFDDTQREATLDEWVAQLPASHRAHMELKALKACAAPAVRAPAADALSVCEIHGIEYIDGCPKCAAQWRQAAAVRVAAPVATGAEDVRKSMERFRATAFGHGSELAYIGIGTIKEWIAALSTEPSAPTREPRFFYNGQAFTCEGCAEFARLVDELRRAEGMPSAEWLAEARRAANKLFTCRCIGCAAEHAFLVTHLARRVQPAPEAAALAALVERVRKYLLYAHYPISTGSIIDALDNLDRIRAGTP